MAKKRRKKGSAVKTVVIVVGAAVAILFGLPVLMNAIRPGGTVNPNLPMGEPPQLNRMLNFKPGKTPSYATMMNPLGILG